MSKISEREQEKIISLYGSQMSVSDITREINKDKPVKLQVSRQAVSKILKEFKSCGATEKVAGATDGDLKTDNIEVARTIYNRALSALNEKLNKANASDLLKIVEYFDKRYNFGDEGSDETVTGIVVEVEDASGDSNNDTEDQNGVSV